MKMTVKYLARPLEPRTPPGDVHQMHRRGTKLRKPIWGDLAWGGGAFACRVPRSGGSPRLLVNLGSDHFIYCSAGHIPYKQDPFNGRFPTTHIHLTSWNAYSVQCSRALDGILVLWWKDSACGAHIQHRNPVLESALGANNWQSGQFQRLHADFKEVIRSQCRRLQNPNWLNFPFGTKNKVNQTKLILRVRNFCSVLNQVKAVYL